MDTKTYLIFGVSKGLGKEMVMGLPQKHDEVYGISRSKPDYSDTQPTLKWIATDLSNPEQSVRKVKEAIGNAKVDYLIYNVGIWESDAFTYAYNFEAVSAYEIQTMMNTNVTSCMLHIQSMITNLRLSSNAKIILVGSTWGLENHKGKEVAFPASKFALRGVVHALRENLREDKIGVSILNLGYLATEFGLNTDIQKVIEETNGELIPLQDVIQAMKFILSTSNATCVKEIDMPAMHDLNA